MLEHGFLAKAASTGHPRCRMICSCTAAFNGDAKHTDNRLESVLSLHNICLANERLLNMHYTGKGCSGSHAAHHTMPSLPVTSYSTWS